MKKNQSSLTAAGIAIVRAVESEKPAGERICFDPYARRFVNAGLFYFVKFFAVLGYAGWRGPGVWEFLAARERYIDDYLEACLREGLEQLVILGAGYDARAYRFEALKHEVKVFEVDHPVTQYLTPQAVDDTLAFVSEHSGPGSSIIFDYMDTTLLGGRPRHGEISGMRRYRRLTGEGLAFGIPMNSIRAFLEERGFTQVKNADHVALEKAYYSGSLPRKVADGYAIALAVVRRDGDPNRVGRPHAAG